MLKGQLSDSSLRLLRIYKTVVDCGGFAAAEAELNISRSAISLAMSDLEQRLGLRLCQRGRTGFALTDEGAKVYDSTLQLLGSMETFRTQVNELHNHLRGELNIGITDNLVTMPYMRVTDALKSLHTLGPSVKINIRMIPPKDIELEVLDGRLHIGAVPELRPLTGLNYLSLYDELSCLYCSSEHPLFDLEDALIDRKLLSQQAAVLPAYAQTVAVKELMRDLKPAATSTDREGIAFLILTGQYIGYLPIHYAQRWLNEGRMRALLPDELNYKTAYAIITRKGARSNLVVKTFIEQLLNTSIA